MPQSLSAKRYLELAKNMDHKPVVTRIPPSPTGNLHVGTARTALYNYLFARQQGGRVMLRSEDTDSVRSTSDFEANIITGLQWLGIEWDNEIWRQSERTDKYQQSLQKLLDSDYAYQSTEPSKHDSEQMVTVVRLRNPNKTITFNDIIRGEITFDTTELGDFVIARAIDDPLYHLTVVVDDADMAVTHVLRGEDHISNTPRQILIQEALGYPRPLYGHIPLILATDRSKLSKRKGAVSIDEYRAMGFLPEALINYLALLGWNPGTEQEIFTQKELIEQFRVEQIQKGGAIFDVEKLAWINKCHLQKRPLTEQIQYVLDAFAKQQTQDSVTSNRIERLAPTILERYHTQAAIHEAARAGEWGYIFEQPDLKIEQLQWKNDPHPSSALPRLKHIVTLLHDTEFTDAEAIKNAVFPYAEEVGRGEVLWPFRIALTGAERSPDPFTIAYTLGKKETLDRLQNACAILER